MNEPKPNVPKLRFPGFTEPWEQRKLGDLGTVEMCRRIYRDQTSEYGDVPFYKIGTFGGKPDAYISRELFESYRENYPYPKPGTLLISAAGSIGRIVEYAGEDAYYQDSNIVWLEHDQSILDCFLKHVLSNMRWNLEGSTVKRLYNKDILEARICIPCICEQKNIGSFFAIIDNLITLHQRKLDNLKLQKRGLLQKMFPRDGADVPEIRFPGFTDPWEQRELGELYDFAGSGGTPTATNPSYYGGDIPFLGISDIDGRSILHTSKTITNEGLNNSAAWIVPAGAVCLAMYASVGKVGINRQDVATSQAFFNMVFNDANLRDFIFTRLEKAEITGEWEPYIGTGAQRNLNAKAVKEFAITMPAQEEMSRIAKLFSSLDDLITLHQRKLDHLKLQKKALLQQMFV